MLIIIARKICYSVWLTASISIGLMIFPAMAQNNIPLPDHIGGDDNCEHITRIVEKTFAMPDGILTAITRIEAGRITDNGTREGWPWTINHAGKGLFFDSKDKMLAYAEDQLVDGDQNMDIGCMQISHYWHSENFTDLEEMGDPFTNIAYAAAFLSDLEATHGSWDQAIRHYHNANPEQNTPYVNKVYAAWDAIGSTPAITDTMPANIKNDTTSNIMPSTASLDAFPIDITTPDMILPELPVQEQVASPTIAPITIAPITIAPVTVTPVATLTVPEPQDPLDMLKAKQPHLKGKWDKVEAFRELLNY